MAPVERPAVNVPPVITNLNTKNALIVQMATFRKLLAVLRARCVQEKQTTVQGTQVVQSHAVKVKL